MFILADISNGIVAGATVILVGVTAVYTWLTHRLVNAQTAPVVVVYTAPSSRGGPYVDIVIENVGAGVAYNVRFSSNRPIPPCWLTRTGQRDQGPIWDGIPALGPHQRRVMWWNEYSRLEKEIGEEPIEIIASYSRDYRDDSEREMTRNPLEVRSIVREPVKSSREPMDDIADGVRRIADKYTDRFGIERLKGARAPQHPTEKHGAN